MKVLVEMREELRMLGEVRDELRAFRHDTNQRLEAIEHTTVDFGTQVVLLGRRHDGDVERHDEEIADLRTRVEKLEAKE